MPQPPFMPHTFIKLEYLDHNPPKYLEFVEQFVRKQTIWCFPLLLERVKMQKKCEKTVKAVLSAGHRIEDLFEFCDYQSPFARLVDISRHTRFKLGDFENVGQIHGVQHSL